MRKRFLFWGILLALSLLVWRAWPMVGILTQWNLRTDQPFSQLDHFIAPVGEPFSVCHEGLAHQTFDPIRLWTQILLTDRRSIHGHVFARKAVKGTVVDEIGTILQDPRSFSQWSGEKTCGGFHADYYFRWRFDSGIVEAMLCNGCEEVLFFADGQSLRCDLSPSATRRIKQALLLPAFLTY